MLLLVILKRSGKVHISLLPVCHFEHEILLTKHCLRKKKKKLLGVVCRFKVTLSLASCKVEFFFFYNITTDSSLVGTSYKHLPMTHLVCLLTSGFAFSYGETVFLVWLELL